MRRRGDDDSSADAAVLRESARGAVLRDYVDEAVVSARDVGGGGGGGFSRGGAAGSVAGRDGNCPTGAPEGKGKDADEDLARGGFKDENTAAEAEAEAAARARWANISQMHLGGHQSAVGGGIRAFSAVAAERRRREEAAWLQEREQEQEVIDNCVLWESEGSCVVIH